MSVYFSCSFSTRRSLCNHNDTVVIDAILQEMQAKKISDFPLRNIPDTVIWPINYMQSITVVGN